MSNPDAEAGIRHLYAVLDEALADPTSPEVKQHYDRLCGLGIVEAEARSMLAARLAIWQLRQVKGQQVTYDDLVAELEQLPEIDDELRAPEGEAPEWDEVVQPRPKVLPRRSKMSLAEITRDPFYTAILFQIEMTIRTCDEEARSRNLSFTDSQVRSILNKVRKKAEGGSPTLPSGAGREELLASMYDRLVKLRTEMRAEFEDGEVADLPTRDWLLSVRTVEDSIRFHRSGSGPRPYLDYIKQFLV